MCGYVYECRYLQSPEQALDLLELDLQVDANELMWVLGTVPCKSHT